MVDRALSCVTGGKMSIADASIDLDGVVSRHWGCVIDVHAMAWAECSISARGVAISRWAMVGVDRHFTPREEHFNSRAEMSFESACCVGGCRDGRRGLASESRCWSFSSPCWRTGSSRGRVQSVDWGKIASWLDGPLRQVGESARHRRAARPSASSEALSRATHATARR